MLTLKKQNLAVACDRNAHLGGGEAVFKQKVRRQEKGCLWKESARAIGRYVDVNKKNPRKIQEACAGDSEGVVAWSFVHVIGSHGILTHVRVTSSCAFPRVHFRLTRR